MLRKNNIVRKQSTEKNSVACQTEQFLVFLAMQQKLESVYRQYRELQLKYDQANCLIQHLTYKNKYLETSLCDISIAFNHSIIKNNFQHIQEIKNLEEIIIKESIEQAGIHQESPSQCYSIIQEQNKKHSERKPTKSKDTTGPSLYQKCMESSPSMIKYRKISAIQQSNIEGDNSRSPLSQSQNEFMPVLPQSAILAEKSQNISCESARYEKPHKISQDQKYATSRLNGDQKQKKPLKTKRTNNLIDKQNINYEKLIRIEAQLKMKEFMQKFQMDSRLREPLDFNIYEEQLDLHEQQEETSESGFRTIR